jgi:hypothetical protein
VSASRGPFSEHKTARPSRRAADAAWPSPAREGPVGLAGQVLELQRTIGNQAVARLLQRDAAPDDGGATPSQQVSLAPVEQRVPLSTPEPIPVAPEGSGPGDYPQPDNSDVAMAMRVAAGPAVQRDGDDTPKLGPDVSVGGSGTVTTPSANPRTGSPPPPPAPWTLSSTVVLRNFNVLQCPDLHLDFLHEPSLQLQIDPAGGLSAQAAIALIDLHWMAPWHREVELSVSPFVQTSLSPLALSQIGAQGQAEAHVTGTLSLTLSASGAYQFPQPGQSGGLNVTGGAGLLLHFDWDKVF